MEKIEKLTLEHLIVFFPYGLQCEILNYKTDYVGEQYGVITGYYWYDNEPHYMFNGRSVAGKDSSLFKPILRPLSDLTKEIEHNGEKFVPIEEIDFGYYDVTDYTFFLLESDDLQRFHELPFFVVNQLISWHFDIFGLIKSGLAIDINTLKS